MVLPCRPDGRTFAASNFLIKTSCVRIRRMAGRTGDLLHAISIFVERASGPWQTGVWTVEFELQTCLKE
jgi:hypothetical protein